MHHSSSQPCTAFDGFRRIAAGPLTEVALAAKAAVDDNPSARLLVFDDLTGAVIDLDLRGDAAAIAARLMPATPPPLPDDQAAPRGRGRPKLGVVAREVTLLPRHWDWLAAQAGGASQAIRRLVDEARRAGDGQNQRKAAQAAAYRFMAALAGDLPGFEEATRALFAADADRFAVHTAQWPEDVRVYARQLARDGASPG